jgi:hypothetical protein
VKQAFIERTFSASSENMIALVNRVLDKYNEKGHKLSLRQLYYQLVTLDSIPNNVRSYKNLGSLVSNARQAGLVDWDMIEDRNRSTNVNSHWNNPAHIIESASSQFRIDKWANQYFHIEVLCEKDALSGLLVPVCRGLDVGITANKGYSSSSTMYEIGQRLSEKAGEGKQILVVYLGDHDPSGIDMGRDVKERLETYSELECIEFSRIALNYDQIMVLNPPENPAKESDARFAAYVKKFGKSSWELDAIEPEQLAKLVTDAVLEKRDDDLWQEAVQKETAMREQLLSFAKEYNEENPEEDNDSEDEDD